MPRTNPTTTDTPNGRRRRTHALRRAALAVCLLLAPGLAARAQQQQPQQQPSAPPAPATNNVAPAPVGETIDDDEVLRIDSNLVHIPALVTETTGRAVPDLGLEDFELRIDGQLKTIGELSRSDTPVALAVLFDNSSSLSKARAFEKQAATRFLTRIVRPIDRASVYSVSTVPVLVRPFTNSVHALVRTVEQFPEPEGATALFDAVAEAAAYLRPQEGRRVIVIVSDGNDTISEQSFDQALQRALKADCQIYVVGTGDIESQSFGDTVARRRLQVFAAQTGGSLYIPRTVQDLDYAFEQISRDISQQYVLSYHPVDDPTDGRFRVIDLRVRNRPALRVRAREGYYAAMGQARVRPRTTRDARAGNGAASRKPAQHAAPRPETQAASLDPLYAGGGLSVTRAESRPSSDVTFTTKSSASGREGNRASARRGPQESEAAPEPVRAGEAESAQASAVQSAHSTAPAFVPSDVASAAPSRQSLFEVAPAAPQPIRANPEAEPAPDASARTTDTTANTTQTQPASYESTAPAPAASPAAAGAAPAASEPKPHVSGGVLNGRALRLPPPLYPSAARTARAAGNVVIEVEIDEEGRVVSAQAVSGHRMLHGAALQAARQARFSPTLLSGQPVRIKGTIVYNFINQ